ncbi:MAG: TonB-dependent receptor [Cyclobacteriaceae bacterium]|nr:TonB-dependent receptor [Cyclobacteriaceae bacterium]
MRLVGKVLVVLALSLASFSGFSQEETIKLVFGDSTVLTEKVYSLTGTIKSELTGEPIPGAHFYADGLVACATDQFGKYYMQLKSGMHKLALRHISMAPKFFILFINENGVYNTEMTEKAFQLEELIVSAEGPSQNLKQTFGGIATLKISQLKVMPALAGEPDLMKSIQLLPGVTTVGEGAAGYNVRGGRVDQNLMLMNEALLISSSHAVGFLSTINTDAIEEFTLYKGAAPGYLGGRSASVLNVRMRNGDYEKWKGQVTAGTAVSKIMAEGPIKKDKASLLFAGRISNANWLLKKVDDPDVENSNVKFNDTYTGLSLKLNSKNFIDANLLTTGDYFRFSQEFGYSWNSLLSSINMRNLIHDNISITTLAAIGNFNNSYFDYNGAKSAKITNGMKYSQLKSSMLITKNENAFTLGIETIHYKNSPEKIEPNTSESGVMPNEVQKETARESAAFITYDWTPVSWFSISAGLRASFFQQLGPDTVFQYAPGKAKTISTITDTLTYNSGVIKPYTGYEPRLSARINLSKNQSIKLSYGRMYQYIHSISNTSSPTPIDLWQMSTTYISPQRADNFSAGYFVNFKSDMYSASIEGFYRLSENQLEYKDFASLYQNNHLETELLSGLGRSYGAEFLMKKNRGKWTGWLSYTYSRSFSKVDSDIAEERINQGEWFASNYDRPNSASLVLTKKIWPRSSFGISTTYITGRPFSAINNYYMVNGAVIPNYSNRNEYRIPNYFRIDLSATAGNVIRSIDDSLTISLYNFLGRNNAYSVFYERYANRPRLNSYQLSILGAMLPSISYTVTFN